MWAKMEKHIFGLGYLGHFSTVSFTSVELFGHFMDFSEEITIQQIIKLFSQRLEQLCPRP